MDIRTIRLICPVAPLDFGNRIVLYHRGEIDTWSLTLPHRLPKGAPGATNDDRPLDDVPIEALMPEPTAAQKAAARIARGKSWKTAS